MEAAAVPDSATYCEANTTKQIDKKKNEAIKKKEYEDKNVCSSNPIKA